MESRRKLLLGTVHPLPISGGTPPQVGLDAVSRIELPQDEKDHYKNRCD